MSIPVSWVESEQGTIKLFSSFELQIGLLDYGFHRKKSWVFAFNGFRIETKALLLTNEKISLITSHLLKKGLTVTRKFLSWKVAANLPPI